MHRIRNVALVILVITVVLVSAKSALADGMFLWWQESYGCDTWLWHEPGGYSADCNTGINFCDDAEPACADFCFHHGGVRDFACSQFGVADCTCWFNIPY